MKTVILRIKNRRIELNLYDVYNTLTIIKDNNLTIEDVKEINTALKSIESEVLGVAEVGFGYYFFIYNKNIKDNVYIYTEEELIRHIVGAEGNNLSYIKKQMKLNENDSLHVRPKKIEREAM